MAEAIPVLLSVLAPLLLIFVRWLERKLEPEDRLVQLAWEQDLRLGEMADALERSSVVDVAAIWAAHDRMLLHTGIFQPGADGSGSGQFGDVVERGRDVHGDSGLDVTSSGVRASVESGSEAVRVRPVIIPF